MVRSTVEKDKSCDEVKSANRAYEKKMKDWEAINKEMQQKECPVCHQVGTLKPCDDLQPGEYLPTIYLPIYCESCKVMQRFPIRHIIYR